MSAIDAKQANLLYKKECESKSKEYKVSLGMVEKGRGGDGGGGGERKGLVSRIPCHLPTSQNIQYSVNFNAFYFPGKVLCRVQ